MSIQSQNEIDELRKRITTLERNIALLEQKVGELNAILLAMTRASTPRQGQGRAA